MKGVFGLITFDDLFSKLEWEYKQLASDPNNTYLAFNFFVTAWHLLEWKYPDPKGKNTRKNIRDNEPLLRICEHLAVGAKHFEPTSKKHTSVKASGVFDSWGGSWGESWGSSWKSLKVVLDSEFHGLYGKEVSVKKLADDALEYWKNNK